MQSTNQPAKFLVPFAQNDSAKVEIPATSADPTRFSQSLGSPPLTGMPPEAGGVPPQLEDFNGAMNQIARGVWWALGGGRFAYDAAWATDTLIGGYARGSVLPAALGTGMVGMGEWYNNTEANTADPDVLGTGWVPGYHYGSTALTGQTGGTVTLTPAQAAKRVITVAGTLTSNLVLVLPGWIYSWRIVNNTGGAFTVTVKNAATAAVEIPQNGAPTIVNCDGTQVSLDSPNIAPAVLATQPMQLGQAVGRLLNTQIFTSSGTYTPTAGARRIRVTVVGAGGGGGGTVATSSGQCAVASSGGGGGYAIGWTAATSRAVTVGTAGTGGVAGASGTAGGNSVFGTFTGNGGAGGSNGNSVIPPTIAGPTVGSTGIGGDINGTGSACGTGFALNNTTVSSGTSGTSYYGGGVTTAVVGGASNGVNGGAFGAGGSGAVASSSQTARNGGNGGGGVVVIEEFA